MYDIHSLSSYTYKPSGHFFCLIIYDFWQDTLESIFSFSFCLRVCVWVWIHLSVLLHACIAINACAEGTVSIRQRDLKDLFFFSFGLI
jgi:hypothetical protein